MQDKLKIIVFSAPWCAACQILKKHMKEKAVEFEEVNIDEDVNAVSQYGIRSLPTTIALKDDEIVMQAIGSGAVADVLEVLGQN
ncbi:MAG: thioredoxin family protein [Gammaproteobacteria bacterium]|nr:thioredoxin family protein [Gammaproteobacteria bacterium]